MMEIGEAILKAVNEKKVQDFIETLPEFQKGCKSLLEDLKEIIHSLEFNQLNSLWTSLEVVCSSTVLRCLNDNHERDTETFNKGLSVLFGITTVAAVTIDGSIQNIPDGLLESAIVLHGLLPTLNSSHLKLKNKISNLCETWWLKDITGKENLLLNVLIYFLQKTTEETCVKADLKRLWALRYGFKIIEFDNEDGRTIRELFEACAASRNFLEVTEGRRILSMILCMDKDTMDDLHSIMKKKLLFCSAKQVKLYGEVYYKAWSSLEGPLKEKLEEDCIQDIVFHAVHAKSNVSHSPAIPLIGFLNTFHDIKHRETTSMMFRLYEPILWRSFKVPNSDVRTNATKILFSAFPLENHELALDENECWLQKQYSLMKDLLVDPCPTVRKIAIFGVCNICNCYWEIIPNDVIRSLLLILINDLSLDTSSAVNRAAVFKGLAEVLKNPLSHSFLKTVLPQISNSFHDVSESVRVAVVDLLLKIKTIKSIEYWDIVPTNHLFARLAVDTPPVARRIVKLLFNSFFPKKENDVTALDRAGYLIANHFEAARKFYRYAHELMDVETAVKFMLRISKFLRTFIVKDSKSKNESNENGLCVNEEEKEGNKENSGKTRKNKKKRRRSTKEEDQKDEDESNELIVFGGLIDVVCLMWAGIHPKLQCPENSKFENQLHNSYKDIVELFMRYYKDSSLWDSILFLMSFLPSQLVASIRKHCLIYVRSLSADTSPEAYNTYILSLCKWGCVEELVDLLSSWLAVGLAVNQPTPTQKGNDRRSVRFKEPYDAQPTLALNILIWTIENPHCQDILLKNRPPILACWQQLNAVKVAIEQHLAVQTPLNNSGTDEFLELAFATYCRITIILQKEPLHSSARFMGEILQWATQVLLPFCAEINAEENSSTTTYDCRIDFCIRLIQALLLMISNMLQISFVNNEFLLNVKTFTKSIMSTENSFPFVENVSRLIYQLTAYALSRKTQQERIKYSNLSAIINESLLSSLRRHSNCNISGEKIPDSLKSIFSETVTCYYRYKAIQFQSYQAIISTWLVSVLTDVGALVEKDCDYEGCDSWEELPVLTRFFLTLFTSRESLIRLFVKELEKCIQSGELTKCPGPLVIASLLQALIHEPNCLKMPEMKSILSKTEKLMLSVSRSLEDNVPQGLNSDRNSDVELSVERKSLQAAFKLFDKISQLLNPKQVVGF